MNSRIVIAGILTALAAVPLAAQSRYEKDTGSQISIPERAKSPDRKLSEEELGREMMNRYARCIVDRTSGKVAEAIALKPGDDIQAFNKAATDECLDSGRMQFSASVLRGAVFGELYRRQQKGVKDVVRKFPVQPLDWSAAPPPGASERARANYFLLWLSDCVHGSSAEAMRSVVMNPVGSKVQQAAYSAVIPMLGPCIPEGQKLSFSRSMLESAFGEYLYRSQVPAIPVVKEDSR